MSGEIRVALLLRPSSNGESAWEVDVIQQVLALAILFTLATGSESDRSEAYLVTPQRVRATENMPPFVAAGRGAEGSLSSHREILTDPAEPAEHISQVRPHNGSAVRTAHPYRFVRFSKLTADETASPR